MWEKKRPKVLILFCIPECVSVFELFSCSENDCLYLEREIGYCVLGTAALDGLECAFKVCSPPKQRAFSSHINRQWLFSSPSSNSLLFLARVWKLRHFSLSVRDFSVLSGRLFLEYLSSMKNQYKKCFCGGNLRVTKPSDSTSASQAIRADLMDCSSASTLWNFLAFHFKAAPPNASGLAIPTVGMGFCVAVASQNVFWRD